MNWPNVTKVCRRCCTISSAFVAAAAVTGEGIWGLEGGGGGAFPWLGERQGIVEGWVLGRGSCAKVSSDGLMISSVPTSPLCEGFVLICCLLHHRSNRLKS